jgi:integrase
MGIVRRKGSSFIWMNWTDASGVRQFKSSGLPIGEEAEAQKTLDSIMRTVEAERELLAKATTPLPLPSKGVTLGVYARHWHRQRQHQKPQAAKEDRWKLDGYIYPAFEHMLLGDVRTRHARGFVHELKAKKNPDGSPVLAPRTVRAIWSTFHSLINDAVADELISTNPCVLKRGDLPPVEDKDPDWRAGAVYDRAEVEQLISDERIPLSRRVLNGLLFLAGFRPSEAFALRWKHYDASLKPLGRLDLMRAFNTAMRSEKGLKVAAKRRLVPVHPTLARLLAEWKLAGWEAHVGRKPASEELLISNPAGSHLRVDDAYDAMLEDQEMLGWRKRRLYDSRRTFISLALADGASRDLLRWVTHGPKSGEVMDLYTSIPWGPLCAEVAKLRITLRQGKLVELRRASGMQIRDSECDSPPEGDKMLSDSKSRHPDLNRRPTDYEGVSEWGSTRTIAENCSSSAGLSDGSAPCPALENRAPVTLSHQGVSEALLEAAAGWDMDGDSAALRDRLTALLALLNGGAR